MSEEKAQAAPGHCQVPDMAAADAATSSATPGASSYMADAAPSPALSTGCAGGSSGGSSQRKDSASWHSILGDDRPMRGKRNDKSNAASPDAPSAGSWSSWASVSADFQPESNEAQMPMEHNPGLQLTAQQSPVETVCRALVLAARRRLGTPTCPSCTSSYVAMVAWTMVQEP